MLRSPNDWPAAQRDFRQLYGLDVWADFARTPVLWQVAPTNERQMAYALGGNEPTAVFLMIVWPLDAPAGSNCLLAFESAHVPAPDVGTGVLVGEVGVNAVLCLETDDPVVPLVWPTYNPLVPVRRHPKPDTSDA